MNFWTVWSALQCLRSGISAASPTNRSDGRGNYTLGIKEQIIFREIDADKVAKINGMDITFVTTAKTDLEAMELLKGSACRSFKRDTVQKSKLISRSVCGTISDGCEIKENTETSDSEAQTGAAFAGRSRAYMRKFGVCRLCFRSMALDGKIPGVTKGKLVVTSRVSDEKKLGERNSNVNVRSHSPIISHEFEMPCVRAIRRSTFLLQT